MSIETVDKAAEGPSGPKGRVLRSRSAVTRSTMPRSTMPRSALRRASMRRTLGSALATMAVYALALAPTLAAQETQVVSGVVVDADTDRPVADAVISIRGTGLGASTDAEGRFEISGVPVGDAELVLQHIAYGEHAQPLVVESTGPLDLRIEASAQAIELAPLDVEVMSPEARAQRASGTATNVIDRATIEAFPSRGDGLLSLLQARIPSLRVHGDCVEYRVFQQRVVSDPVNPEIAITTPCRDITVYVDGVPDLQGSDMLRQLSTQDVERIQLLSPSEAGLQYMDGNRGVILVETRPGVVTDSPYRIHVTGFGWDEPEPYPWPKVLGVSLLGNAAIVGVLTHSVLQCGQDEDSLSPPRCNPAAGLVSAFLTSAATPLITRWAGKTDYTEGRTYPALFMSIATASVGYLLYVHGENEGSDASRTAGQVVLAVGVPISLTFADRIFRMFR